MRRFCRKMGESGSLFLKNGWESVVFVKKWVGVGCFSRKMGESGSLSVKIDGGELVLLINWWEWVAFVEK